MLVYSKRKQKGFTLIEIMIALMLGLIVIGGALSIYISTIRSSSDVVKSARLNYDLDSVMQLMDNDIKRAGYWGGAVTKSDTRLNPFTTLTTTINIRTLANPTVDPGPNAGDCILYSYDADEDGNVDDNNDVDDVDDIDEHYGFKLDRGAVWIRYSGATTASCADGLWERITDENEVLITNLQFSFLATAAQAAIADTQPALPALTATSRCLNITADTVTNAINCATVPTPVTSGDDIAQKRVINIHLSGYVNGDMSVVKSLSASVKVSNARIYIAP